MLRKSILLFESANFEVIMHGYITNNSIYYRNVALRELEIINLVQSPHLTLKKVKLKKKKN